MGEGSMKKARFSCLSLSCAFSNLSKILLLIGCAATATREDNLVSGGPPQVAIPSAGTSYHHFLLFLVLREIHLNALLPQV
jgi:hypothetical protein